MAQVIFEFVQYRISMVFLLVFLLCFLTLRYKKTVSCLLAAGCFFVTFFLDGFTFLYRNEVSPTLAMTLLQAFIVQLTAYLLSRYRDFRAIFTGVISSTYILGGNIVSMLLWMHSGNAAMALTAGTLLHLCILLLFVKQMRKSYLMEMDLSKRGWERFVILPLLIYAAVYSLTVWPGNIHNTPENWAAIGMILLLMIASYVMMFRLLFQKRIDSELAKSLEFMDVYAHSMRHEMEAVRQSENEMAVYRHDMRHIYRLLYSYLESGETDRAMQLLKQSDAELDKTVIQHFCDNVAINSVIANMAARARKAEVVFSCKAEVPAQMEHINELELAVVTLNLLENALHAVQSLPEVQRWVRMAVFPVKALLMLEIINPYAGICELSEETGLPVSGQGSGHGYGLRSVQAFAEKNHAFFKISFDNGQFKIQLMVKP